MKIGIIGAGASGMMAAVAAAEQGAEVILIEKNERIGKKILATGNGKCNLSNLDFSVEKYYCDNQKKMLDIFKQFSVEDALAFFQSKGLMLRDKDGYVYPYSEQASTVLDFFRNLLLNSKITIETGQKIETAYFHKDKGLFVVKSENKHWMFDRLIIACGGPAALKDKEGQTGFVIAKNFGHTIKKCMPALVQLKSDDKFLKAMAGVRFKAAISVLIDKKVAAKEQGEVQFTDYGISGIPVFQISRLAAYALDENRDVTVVVNFFPDYSKEEFSKMIRERYQANQNATLEEFLTGTVNKKIHQALMKNCGYKPEERILRIGLSKIENYMQLYAGLKIHITATNGMTNAQVSAGGVILNEVCENMESSKQAGLFFAGEVLDVDGKCGGYNLQWAWTSGYVAGKAAAGETQIND